MSIASTVKTIDVIPAVELIQNDKSTQAKKERVAAYARVSTDSEDQLNSYKTQCEFYREKLSNDPNIIFIGLYADEGLTGTKMRKRPDFLRMLEDCRAGKITRIITKSVQRFARNAVECLSIAKELANKGVTIKFETTGIDTADPSSWLILGIMATVAEEEVRTISHNITWTFQKKFARGEYMGGRIYGYDTKNNFKIIDHEAVVVRRIFDEFIAGKTCNEIKNGLEQDHIKSPKTGKPIWYAKTVEAILKNEKYCGDLLLQKTYKTDVLCERRINNGAKPKYLVRSNHLGIVGHEQFDQVQKIFAARQSASQSKDENYTNGYAFSSIVECGECGSKFRRHCQWSVDHSKKVPIWVCINHQLHHDQCSQKPIKESCLEQGFLDAVVRLCSGRDDILAKVRENARTIISSSNVDHLQALLETRKAKQTELVKISTISHPNDEQQAQSVKLVADIKDLNEKIEIIQKQTDDISFVDYRIKEIEKLLENAYNEFDKDICKIVLDKVIIKGKHLATYVFKCGIAIDQNI